MKDKVGLGFRRDIADDIIQCPSDLPEFIEFAPENWMEIGGHWRDILEKVAETYPITTHGLSLSIGSPGEIDTAFLDQLKQFFSEIPVVLYSEHLSYSKCNNAHLFDLMPIPFRKEAVDHIVDRINFVQDYLGRQLVLENVSYYTSVAPEMKEFDFINQIISKSECGLLLDVNNVYVNAFNHNYDPRAYIEALPLNKVAYIHMAGHEKVQEDLTIDTHGMPIIDPVFELFDWTLSRLHPVPVLLERDFNIPDMEELQVEMRQLKSLIEKNRKVKSLA